MLLLKVSNVDQYFFAKKYPEMFLQIKQGYLWLAKGNKETAFREAFFSLPRQPSKACLSISDDVQGPVVLLGIQ